jgi:transcriptional regulator with XRE-family HTH domain
VISGAVLRELRLRTGRRQREVAEMAGIPASVLSAYERGRREPGLGAASRILDVLGYRVEFIRLPDQSRQARRLEEVLTLAEALPYRSRRLAKARM